MREFHVYILALHPFGALYVGVTSELVRRLEQHRSGAIPSFTRRSARHRLVYVEAHSEPLQAIRREKRLKRWSRAWKIELIQAANPSWRDLALAL